MYCNDQKLIKDENSNFAFAALSVIGDRADQQDSFGYTIGDDEGLIVVCDGMGGHDGGKLASDLAVQTFLKEYDGNRPFSERVQALIGIAQKTDNMISQLRSADGNLLKAGSTLVSVAINRNRLIWCSVGDSRAYLFRDGEFVQLTQDHNYHEVLVEKLNAGLISEAEFQRENERGEALISFLGIGNLGLIDYAGSPLELISDDKIIIMSDGLYKLVTDQEIARIIDNFSNIEEAVQILELKAKKNAKNSGDARDNTTIALVKIK